MGDDFDGRSNTPFHVIPRKYDVTISVDGLSGRELQMLREHVLMAVAVNKSVSVFVTEVTETDE